MYKVITGFVYFGTLVDNGTDFIKNKHGDYINEKIGICLPAIFVEHCSEIFMKVGEPTNKPTMGAIKEAVNHDAIEAGQCDMPDKETNNKIEVSYAFGYIHLHIDMDNEDWNLIKSKLQAFFDNLLNQ